MDNSPLTSEDILHHLSSPCEVIKNLDAFLPDLIVSLENDYCSSPFQQIITGLFRSVLKELEVEVIEKKILCQVLPSINKIFSQSLSSIGETLELVDEIENEETSTAVRQFLQVCLDILSGYNDLLDYLSLKTGEINCEYVESLHKTLPPILILAFSHCKDSEDQYGMYFSVSTDILTVFFRKAYEVYLKYIKALEEKLSFNCIYEDDVGVLSKVLGTSSDIIEILTGLDIKTAAEQWKGYAKLISKYSEKLKDRIDLIRPLTVLASNISQIIKYVSTEEDDKSRTRLLKLGSFLLKVFIKICELYNGYLVDSLPQILEILILLNSCSRSLRNDVNINKELEAYICIGAPSLLNQFLNDNNFFNELHKIYTTRKKFPHSQLGLFFTILVTMKKIAISQSKAMLEISQNYPLLEMAITLYNEIGLQTEVNCQIEGKDLYGNIISILMTYMVSTVTPNDYHNVENLLIKHLFSPNIHTSLMVSDLLCLVARFATDNLCMDLTQFLCEILLSWPTKFITDRPEYIIVSMTVVRLCRLLTEKSRNIIREKYGEENETYLSFFIIKALSQKSVSLKNSSSIDVLFKQNYYAFFVQLKLLSLKSNIEEESEKVFSMCLACFSVISEESDPSEEINGWIEILAYQLIRLLPSLLPSLANSQIVQVLSSLIEVVKCSNSRLKLACIHFLQNSGKLQYPTDSFKEELFFKIAELYVIVLEDKDHLMQLSALQSYTHFASHTSYDDVISLILNYSNEIQEILTLFLQKKLSVNKRIERINLADFIYGFQHKCLIKKTIFLDTIEEYPPCKKLKQNTEDENFEKRIVNLLKEVKQLKPYTLCHKLSEHCKKMLAEVNKEIEDVKNIVARDDVVFDDIIDILNSNDDNVC